METITRNGRLTSDGFCAFVNVLWSYFTDEYSSRAVFRFARHPQLQLVRTTQVACGVRQRCKHMFSKNIICRSKAFPFSVIRKDSTDECDFYLPHCESSRNCTWFGGCQTRPKTRSLNTALQIKFRFVLYGPTSAYRFSISTSAVRSFMVLVMRSLWSTINAVMYL